MAKLVVFTQWDCQKDGLFLYEGNSASASNSSLMATNRIAPGSGFMFKGDFPGLNSQLFTFNQNVYVSQNIRVFADNGTTCTPMRFELISSGVIVTEYPLAAPTSGNSTIHLVLGSYSIYNSPVQLARWAPFFFFNQDMANTPNGLESVFIFAVNSETGIATFFGLMQPNVPINVPANSYPVLQINFSGGFTPPSGNPTATIGSGNFPVPVFTANSAAPSPAFPTRQLMQVTIPMNLKNIGVTQLNFTIGGVPASYAPTLSLGQP